MQVHVLSQLNWTTCLYPKNPRWEWEWKTWWLSTRKYVQNLKSDGVNIQQEDVENRDSES